MEVAKWPLGKLYQNKKENRINEAMNQFNTQLLF